MLPRFSAPLPWRFLAAAAAVLLTTHAGLAITTDTGMRLPGRVARIGSVNELPSGEPAPKPIVIIDDNLRRTFVPYRQVTGATAPIQKRERIRISQRVATTGRSIEDARRILGATPFDEFGRRTVSLQGPRGQVDVIQGITEITPEYTRVQAILVENSYVWDMRIATSSISQATLSRIILNRIDAEDVDQRLQVVRLYEQARRYSEALSELEAIQRDFPTVDLSKMQNSLTQVLAQYLLTEIQLRKRAGQHLRVQQYLQSFPRKGVAAETLLRVRNILDDYERPRLQYEQVLTLLEEQIALIKDDATREELKPIHDEIVHQLNYNITLNRMADFLRLADDNTITAEQKVALAVSGWLLGSGSGRQNLAVALSLYRTRNEIRTYLTSDRPSDRQASLAKIKAEEGGAPGFVADLIAHMPPPIVTEEGALEIPGFYQLTAPGIEEQPAFGYHIQLPPEYDPYRRYPCVVTLHGTGSGPVEQVDWWAGTYSERGLMRQGQAARQGYIVIAPHWTKPGQREYEFSSREHAAVLSTLRDACRRTSIDTDRIFLSGHSIGGDAAWDIALAHPDLWAGVIPMVAQSAKYVQHYAKNGRLVPMYFVGGEKDAAWLHRSGTEFDRYLKQAGYDVTVVQYLGRGHEHFQDEILRIFEWMDLPAHRREFFPEEFDVVSLRPWDNFFWWLELNGFPTASMALPQQWAPGRKRPSKVSADLRDKQKIFVNTGAKQATIWLSPEFVDFQLPIEISVNGRKVKDPIEPQLETLLEDVRTRADRQHPFWAKVEAVGRVR